MSSATDSSSLDPSGTQHGRLPPWEIAKALAYETVLQHMSTHLDTPASDLLGERVDHFIARNVVLKGGGNPTERAVRQLIHKARTEDWYPGKLPANKGGKPVQIKPFVKDEVARVAMDVKKKRRAPTPARGAGGAARRTPPRRGRRARRRRSRR